MDSPKFDRVFLFRGEWLDVKEIAERQCQERESWLRVVFCEVAFYTVAVALALLVAIVLVAALKG